MAQKSNLESAANEINGYDFDGYVLYINGA